MKKFLTTLFSISTLICLGQSSMPEVEITAVVPDAVAETLTINYMLTDADSDACEVWLKVSIDGGTYYEMVPTGNLSGNVGDGVNPGASLSLIWNYADMADDIAGAQIKLYASDNEDVSIADMVSEVSTDELMSTLETIVGERHYTAAPAHLAAVRTHITTAFANAGLDTEVHDFVHNSVDMQNILGRHAGAKAEDITFIIDGHFDGVPGSPAADDNGSAVAGVLEAVRILSNYSFEHSIRFIGFDGEELGLIGSNRYVQEAIKPFEDIQGVLNFEMIGYFDDAPDTQDLPVGFDILFPAAAAAVADDDNRGNFILSCGNVASNPLNDAFIFASETYVPELRVISIAVPGTGSMAPDLRRSDHARFWDANMQALMLTDGANFRNDNYHTPNDVIATLDLEFMKNVVKATIATAAHLAVPISVDFAHVDLSTVLSVGDHDHHFPAGVSLFPNPSNGLVSLRIEEAAKGFRSRLEVFELSGKRVYRDVLNIAAGTSTTTVDLQHLPIGTYMLVLNSGDATESIGFVIGE